MRHSRYITLLAYVCSSAVATSCFETIPRLTDSSNLCSASNGAYAYLVDDFFSVAPTVTCGATAICGTFTYEKRLLNVQGQALSGDTCKAAFPVQFAEVQLLSSDGTTLVLSTNTDKRGSFSLSPVPSGTTAYRVRLLSRTSTTDALHRVEVFDRYSSTPAETDLYQVDFINAYRRQRLNYTVPIQDPSGISMAGAFNILSVLTNAQDKVVDRFATLMTRDLHVFWESGNQYDTTGLRGPADPVGAAAELLVIGGDPSQLAYSDTDEFDDPILLHEFTHYLEFSLSAFDSPGGFHDFWAVDPRLAYSEGAAHFWSSYFRSEGPGTTAPPYMDTSGYGSTSQFLKYIDPDADETTQTVSYIDDDGDTQTQTISVEGPPYVSSVYEILWDLYDSVNEGTDTATESVTNMWLAFTNLYGSTPTDYGYRGMTTIHQYLDGLLEVLGEVAHTSTRYDILRAGEAMQSDAYFRNYVGTVVTYPPQFFIADGTTTPYDWSTLDADPFSGTGSDNPLRYCGTTVNLPITAVDKVFCWLSARRILGLPGQEPAFTYSAKTNFLSKRWFRLSPGSTGQLRVMLKSGCLPDGTDGNTPGGNYQSAGCATPTLANPGLNNYLPAFHNLNMRIYREPDVGERYIVGVHSDLLEEETVGNSLPSNDDDNFDGNTDEAAGEGADSGFGDARDVNAGSKSMDVSVNSATNYYLEVFANPNTVNNASPDLQMEARFRLFVCDNPDLSLCNGAGDPLGELDDF